MWKLCAYEIEKKSRCPKLKTWCKIIMRNSDFEYGYVHELKNTILGKKLCIDLVCMCT